MATGTVRRMGKPGDTAGCSAVSRMGCDCVISMLKLRVTPDGTDLEDAWITSVLFIIFPFASAARRVRVYFSDIFNSLKNF